MRGDTTLNVSGNPSGSGRALLDSAMRLYLRAAGQYERLLEAHRAWKVKSREERVQQDKIPYSKAGDNLSSIRLSNNHADSYYRSPPSQPNSQPADVLRTRSTEWFQVGGHEDSLCPSGNTVFKLVSGSTNMEIAVYEALKEDQQLRDLVPSFYNTRTEGGRKYIILENLLSKFRNPHVMVLKMGTRTYLESDEIYTEREDLYKKMVKLDPRSPTESEHRVRKVTKKRYMEFREQKSSSAALGFRIEGIRLPGQKPQTAFQNLVSFDQVKDIVEGFISGRPTVRDEFLRRLNHIRERLEKSSYFKKHEMVGTSLYLIYDDKSYGAWLIDFAKTRRVPDDIELNHRTPWRPGTHEEGFLFGLDNIINILKEVDSSSELKSRQDG